MHENEMQPLLEKYLRKEATSSEITALFSAIREDHGLFRKVAESIKVDFTQVAHISPETRQEIIDVIFSAAKTEKHDESKSEMTQLVNVDLQTAKDPYDDESHVRRIPFLTSAWLRYAAAVLIIAAVISYLYYGKQEKRNPEFARTSHPLQHDVAAPSFSRATLTLANGQTLGLDSAAPGTLTMQGAVAIRKTDDGRIVYNGEGNNGDLQYNTLNVPKGSNIAHMVLADGSTVYLNAASSLKYPVSFNGKERRVEVIGEAYFEIVKNAKQPFVVQTPTDVITVHGTQFNVNAYPDEDVVRTTLLEGSVKTNESILKPGEQYANGVIEKVDPLQAIAWKNGNFYFDELDLKSILRQYARWYNIEVIVEGTLNTRKYFAIVKRSSSLSSVLKALRYNDIKFRIEANKLYVKSM